MKVSIVINTLNRGYFLKRLLDSLKYLNYKNFEVIVVNGPSTDKTKDLILPYMKSFENNRIEGFNFFCHTDNTQARSKYRPYHNRKFP